MYYLFSVYESVQKFQMYFLKCYWIVNLIYLIEDDIFIK